MKRRDKALLACTAAICRARYIPACLRWRAYQAWWSLYKRTTLCLDYGPAGIGKSMPLTVAAQYHRLRIHDLDLPLSDPRDFRGTPRNG